MQFPRRGQPAPLGVLYDTSLDGGIDQILALAMLFGFSALQQVRIPSLTTSRYNLKNAAFLDVVARFFAADLAGDFVPNKIPLPIGMAATGKPSDAVPPMVGVPLAKTGADGKPVTGPDGFFIAEKLLFYTAMATGTGWGNDVPEMLRNGNWNYAVFTLDKQHRPGVNQAECYACHKPLDKESYVFTLKQLVDAK